MLEVSSETQPDFALNGRRDHWARCASPLRVRLLGGFRVERDNGFAPVSDWQRRSAKTLIKLLACTPGHALHREQAVELLWPGSDLNSALNSFAKALHAARRAFQPHLLPRQGSAYLLTADSMVALDAERVLVDADQFEELAHDALRRQEISALEAALAAYAGDLLPEDRYADWCAQRRDVLADLRVRLLLEMADLLEVRGAYNDSADRLRKVLQHDPTREDVLRRLMRLHAEMGNPEQAVRQFHASQLALQRELDVAPQAETVALYDDLLANRLPLREASSRRSRERAAPPVPPNGSVSAKTVSPNASGSADPFVGRAEIVAELCRHVQARPTDEASVVVVSGEAGIGKTRLLQELATSAIQQGAVVLWGGAGAHGRRFACGPFAVALEAYMASRPPAEREQLAHRYPPLTRFLASLLSESPTPQALNGHEGHLYVVPAITRLLTDIALHQPVLLVVGDLDDADAWSLDIVRYLAHLGRHRRLLLVGAARDEDMVPRAAVTRLVEASVREGLCRRVELGWLSRGECDQLVIAMLPSAAVNAGLLDRIFTLSRGNPLFVRELVQQMRARDPEQWAGTRVSSAGSVGDPVPSRIQALAEARLASFDTTMQRVLSLSSAASTEEVSLTQLRKGAAALDPPVTFGALLDALDRAVDVRILEERMEGYAFRHPLVRSALYGRLSRHRRAQYQAALAFDASEA
jgi:DNA-binding SARP family transcriptional activator